MKKIILALLSVVVLGSTSMAQDKPMTASKKKADVTQQQQAPAKQEATAGEAKMKKDGTPDMRHKANKEAKKADVAPAPAGPAKKDGTPDMRHKANKEAAAANKK